MVLISLISNESYVKEGGGWNLANTVRGYAIPFSTYFIARRAIGNDEQFRTFFVGLGCIAVYLACNGLAETLQIRWLIFPQFILNPNYGTHLGARVRGIFLVAGPHGLAIAMLLPVLIWLYFTDRVSRRWIWPLIAVLALVPLTATLSRAAWLSSIVALGITAMAWPQRRTTLIGIMVCIAVWGVFFVLKSETIVQRIERRLNNEATIEGRFIRIEAALEMFRANPMFGVGLNRYGAKIGEYSTKEFSHAHNTWITLLAELGLLGALSYVAIFGCALFECIRFYWQYPQYREILGILISITLAFFVVSTSMEIRGFVYHNILIFALWGIIIEAIRRRTVSP
jgi:O-antigen ligase